VESQPRDGLTNQRRLSPNNRVAWISIRGRFQLTGGPCHAERPPPNVHQLSQASGRVPKKKPVQPGLAALGGGIADRVNAMALDEATRPVTVREGDKVSEIPAMQALFRTMFRAAAQGDTKAGRQLLDVIARAESGRAGAALEILQNAVQYKEKYLPVFERHERAGLDPPDIYPHPDDIIIDATGEVKIDGPMFKEQALARKWVRQRALESMRRYFEVEAALAKKPSNRALRREFKELKEYYDFLKDDSQRNTRHEALRLSRRKPEPKSPKPDGDTPDQA
jgi:hypothetical protein